VEKRLQSLYEQINLSDEVNPQLKKMFQIFSEYFRSSELLNKQLKIFYNELILSKEMEPQTEELFKKVLDIFD